MTGSVPVVMVRMHSNYNTIYVPYVVVRNGHLLQVSHGYSIAIFLAHHYHRYKFFTFYI